MWAVPTEPTSWSLTTGTIGLAVVAAVVLTWPVCAVFLVRYRRTVRLGMMRRSTPSPTPTAPPIHPGAPATPAATWFAPWAGREIAVVEAPAGRETDLLAQARRGSARARWTFGIAGVAYAVAMSAVVHGVSDLELKPFRFAALVALYGWPLLPTLLALSTWTRRTMVVAWLVAIAAVLTLVALVGGVGFGQAALLLLITVLGPALFVLMTSARAIRGAAWLVAPALVFIGFAVQMLVPVVDYFRLGGTLDGWSVRRIAIAAGFVVLVGAYGVLMTRIYRAKWISDETLLIIQWWTAAAISQVLDQATQGRSSAVLALIPLGVLFLVLVATLLLVRPRTGRPVRLLLLRTFGARGRSTRLLRRLTNQWRWVGSVELIAAPDVASEVLEPDEFLDFLRGSTQHQFVADPNLVETRLSQIDLVPDRDGRYRVNELLCQDDTWRPTVEGLIGGVAAIVLDLRGFTAAKTGVAEELQRLSALVPLRRVVGLLDATTDRAALHDALSRAAALAPPGSPLDHDPRADAARRLRSGSAARPAAPAERTGGRIRRVVAQNPSAADVRPAAVSAEGWRRR